MSTKHERKQGEWGRNKGSLGKYMWLLARPICETMQNVCRYIHRYADWSNSKGSNSGWGIDMNLYDIDEQI